MIYRVAQKKNGTAYFPQYMWMLWLVSVYGVLNFSWEKWYQDQQFWFSSSFSRAHFVRQCWGHKISLFSFKLDVNEWNFGLPQLWAVIHLTLSMRIVRAGLWCKEWCIVRVNWITAHNCGRPKWHSFMSSLSWKGKLCGLNIVSQNGP